MKRGHPWLVARALWPELSEIRAPETLRDFLGRHAEQILYLPVSSDTILRDLDTPDDYAREKPAA
jgi:CTP:molybdopterin cytidylyltransferase MocA